MIKATVILGKQAVNKYDETGTIPSNHWLSNNGGVVDQKEFNTIAEFNAYAAGLNDADGWDETMLLKPEFTETPDCPECEYWRKSFNNRESETFCPNCKKSIVSNPKI